MFCYEKNKSKKKEKNYAYNTTKREKIEIETFANTFMTM